MKRLVYSAIAIMLILVGCVPAAEQPDIVIAPPTSTRIQLPTATKHPSATLGIQATTVLRTPTISPSSTSTPQNYSSLLTAQVSWKVCDGADEPFYKNDLSPDGNWLAVACSTSDFSKFSGARIIKLDGTVLWDVSYHDYYGIYQEDGFSSGGRFEVVHWSKDGYYVYLVPDFCCVDSPQDVFFNYFQNTLALYRLDLRTGKLTATLQPVKNDVFSGYYVSISPTDQYLTYIVSSNPRDVHVSNLQTGDTFTITIDKQYIASGRFSWSQDSNQAIFIALKSGWGSETPVSNGVSYFLLDLKMRTSNRLFDQQDIYNVSWTADRNIILNDVSESKGLLYDFQHSSLVDVTVTPSP